MKTVSMHEAGGDPSGPPNIGSPSFDGPSGPAETPGSSGRRGFLAGRICVPTDFDSLMQDEIVALFEAGGSHERG